MSADSSKTLQKLRDNISRVIVGRQQTVDLLLTCFAAGGHALIEDVPGTGKTMLARSLSASAALEFSRIQFTPDLLPGDVTGLNYFDQSKSQFVFRPGPVFCHILLADEINRATPRTQSALLECMAEGQVTIDGQTRSLEDPFFVIATQNPVETLGTFPLPDAQLDRFLMQISMGVMTQEEELRMIDRFIESEPLAELEACCSIDEILAVRQECRKVFVHPDLRMYITSLVRRTRDLTHFEAGSDAASYSGGSGSGSSSYSGYSGSGSSSYSDSSTASTSHNNSRPDAGLFPAPTVRMEEGVSPRGTLALVRASQGYAMLQGREYVTPEDIQAVALPVLSHRCLSSAVTSTREKEGRILSAITQTEVPTEDWKR